MSSSLELVPTLKLALTQLEAANLQVGPESEDARPALRKLIEACQDIEEAQAYETIEWLEETWLRRKGMLVLGLLTAQNVRDILIKHGFEGLSGIVRNDPLLDLMALEFDAELGRTAEEIKGKIEQEAARRLVEYVGLEWSDSKDPPSSTASGSADAT